jgi:hypothetical protein
LSLDAFVIIATIAVVRNSLRGENTKYPIFLVGGFTLLSIILNTVDVGNLNWLAEFDPWVARITRGAIYVSVHALPPVVVFLSIELAASIGKSEVRRYAQIKSQQQVQQETAALRRKAEAEREAIHGTKPAREQRQKLRQLLPIGRASKRTQNEIGS